MSETKDGECAIEHLYYLVYTYTSIYIDIYTLALTVTYIH